MFGCRFKVNRPHVGPGPTLGVPSVRVFPNNEQVTKNHAINNDTRTRLILNDK